MIETDRLVLSTLSYADCDFVLNLLNEPTFIRFIGDKGVRTVEDAHNYLREGPISSYEAHGFGMFLVTLKDTSLPIGICGLIKREEFEHPDLGFAFLRSHWSKGYAFESSAAVLHYAETNLAIPTVIAMADDNNQKSTYLLERLGFHLDRKTSMPGESKEIGQYKLVLKNAVSS